MVLLFIHFSRGKVVKILTISSCVSKIFRDFENHINPAVSRALTNHGSKVLGRILPYQDEDSEQKNYAFSYKVVDHLTGDDFSHTQSQNEKATSGEYRVKLPDGRVQIVSYKADKNGYQANVKYQDDIEKTPQKLHLDYRNQIEQEYRNDIWNGRYVYDTKEENKNLNFVKSTPATPIHENNVENYGFDVEERKLYSSLPTRQPKLIFSVTQPNYYNYHPVSLSQHSLNTNYVHQNSQPAHRFQIIPQDKVEIVNQGAASVGSTVAPTAYLENPGIILSSTASPPTPSFPEDYQHVFVTNIPDLYSRKK